MKAIINVNKNSSYAMYNGFTFDIKEVFSNTLDLNVYGTTTNFSFTEILIVDINEEIEKLQNDCKYPGSIDARKLLNKLSYYKEINHLTPFND